MYIYIHKHAFVAVVTDISPRNGSIRELRMRVIIWISGGADPRDAGVTWCRGNCCGCDEWIFPRKTLGRKGSLIMNKDFKGIYIEKKHEWVGVWSLDAAKLQVLFLGKCVGIVVLGWKLIRNVPPPTALWEQFHRIFYVSTFQVENDQNRREFAVTWSKSQVR